MAIYGHMSHCRTRSHCRPGLWVLPSHVEVVGAVAQVKDSDACLIGEGRQLDLCRLRVTKSGCDIFQRDRIQWKSFTIWFVQCDSEVLVEEHLVVRLQIKHEPSELRSKQAIIWRCGKFDRGGPLEYSVGMLHEIEIRYISAECVEADLDFCVAEPQHEQVVIVLELWNLLEMRGHIAEEDLHRVQLGTLEYSDIVTVRI